MSTRNALVSTPKNSRTDGPVEEGGTLAPGVERPLVGRRSERAVRTCVALLVAMVWPAAPSAAQAVYGSIAGTVTDSSGARAPGARLTITSLERGTIDTVTSNASGYYIKDRLLPGRYDLKAELKGFKTQVVAPVVVGVDAQTKVDPVLQPGEVTDAITVMATGGQLLKTDRADVATSFEARQVTDLPVLDRNLTRFLLLTPGAQEYPWQHASAENPQGSVQIMVNGQHFSGTGYQLDGTENRDPILGIIVINPTLESVGEAKVTSQNYDAEFGQAIAGVVSVQTRSGANELHGSAFEFLQRDEFQARNPFTQFQSDPVTGRYIPETKRDQFGGSLGGPIVRNRWFFFADYEGLRSLVGGSRLLNVPTDRARTGDLGEYGIPIFDPASGDPSVRQPFPGNVIPPARLSPQTLNILSLIPRPNADGRDNGTRENYVASGSEKFDGDAFNVRTDGRLTKSVNVFARYSLAHFTRDGPTAFGEGGGPALVSLGGRSVATNQSLALGLDYTLSPSSLVDIRFGFFRYKVDVRQTDYGTIAAQDAGIPNMNFDDFSSGLPRGFRRRTRRRFQLRLRAQRERLQLPLDPGREAVPARGELHQGAREPHAEGGRGRSARAELARAERAEPRGGTSSSSHERTSGPGGGGLGLATFLLGDVSLFVRTASQTTEARERQWRHFYYVQDTWRATPKLTLNYGLRLDVINPQTVNGAGNGGFLDLETGEIGGGGRGRDRARRRREEQLELGAPPRRDLSAGREDGGPHRLRPQLRHRRLRLDLRPHRHPEPPGAGPPVPSYPGVLRERLQPRGGPAAARVPGRAGERPLPAAGPGRHLGPARQADAAHGRRLQPDRPAPAFGQPLVRDRLCRKQGHPRLRRRSAHPWMPTSPP